MVRRLAAVVVALLLSTSSFAAITGVVMTSDGAPVAGAKVTIGTFDPVESRRLRLVTGAAAPAPIATTQTDAKGAFSFDSPKEALVDLRIDARGYEPALRRVERDEEVGAIALRKAEMKRGTVRAGGKPVANAKVMVLFSGADFIATTDAEGRYSAPDAKNAGRIIVVHPDYAVSDETFNPNAPGADRLDRTLVAGSAWSGKVVGQDNKTPVAKAEIWVDGWPVATSAEDGTFTIAHLPPKWQSITAQSGSLAGARSRASDGPKTIRLARAAVISGTVRDAKTQTPIPNATVRLGPQRFADAETQVMLSDAKGNFSFTTAPGSFRLTASHPAYDAAFLQAAAAAGQNVAKNIQIGQLARISGSVLDEDKQPIAAALLTAEEVRGGDEVGLMPMRMMRAAADTRSGPDGRFTIRVPDSEVRLNAVKKGLPAAKSDNLRVVAGERKRGVVITIPRGFELTGKVTDRDGKPLSGVGVSAAEAQGGPGMMMTRIMIGGPRQDEDNVVKTGSDGTFSMRLKEGTYDVFLRREGFASKTVRGHTVSSATRPIEASLDPSVDISGRIVRGGVGIEGVNIFSFAPGSTPSQAVSGPDGTFVLSDLSPGSLRVSFNKPDDFVQEVRNLTAPAHDVLVEVPPGGRISGRVVDKATRQPVTVFQAGVSVSRGGGGMVMVGPPQMRSFTADDGSFTLENVAAGAVNLMVSAPGYTTSRVSNISVEEGKSVSDVVVEMDTGTKLVGRVTGPDGTPLAGASVRQSMTNPMRAMTAFGANELAATTEANGEYTIEAVEPGEKTFMFTHPDFIATTKSVDVTGRETRLDAQLSSGLRVSGMVVTEAGAPVADASVRALSASGSASMVRSGAGGAFSFDRLAPGRYTFSAAKPGLADGIVRDFDVASGGQVRIAMKSGGTIYGHVSGLSETELAQTMVEVRGSEGSSGAPVDSSGNYRLEGAPTGTVRVTATVMRSFPERRTSQPKTVELQAGDARQVDIEFRTDTVVTGRVTRNGQPVTNGSVSFSPRRGAAQASASVPTDAAGMYSIAGLGDGEYNVMVMDMQRVSPYMTTFEVHGSGTFDIDMRTTTLRGRVVDAGTGDPIGDAHVQLRPAQQDAGFMAQRAANSDMSGNFTIDSVVPGRYSASADKEGYGNQLLDVSVTDGASNDVEFKLSRNDGVTLRVVDARDGRQLSGSVVVTDMQGRVVHDEGGFRIGGGAAADMRLPLAPGSYRATVGAYGYATQTVGITSPGRQTIGLTPGGTLVIRSKESAPRRARLIDASGAPYYRGGYRMPTFTVDVGTNTFQNIAPGTYTLQLLDNNDNIIGSVSVQVVEGQTMSYDA